MTSVRSHTFVVRLTLSHNFNLTIEARELSVSAVFNLHSRTLDVYKDNPHNSSYGPVLTMPLTMAPVPDPRNIL